MKYFVFALIFALFACAQGEKGDPGPAGPPGQDAVLDGKTIIEIIDPCGDAANVYDEVLLRLDTNEIVALFADNANGNNPRFALIPAGNYITTDGSNCHFSVDSAGLVTW